MIGFLACPECSAEVFPSTLSGCLNCGGEEGDPRACEGVACEVEPLWTEGEEGPCPDCGGELRVVVEDGGAYAASD